MTIFLGISAINTSNNLVYIIVSALLSFMAVSGFFGRGNLKKLELEIEIPPEIFVHKPIPIKITLKNGRKRLPVFLIKVVMEDQELLFPFIDANDKASGYINLTFPQRGRCEIGGGYMTSVFPFYFFIRYKIIRETFQLIIFPEPKTCELFAAYLDERQSQGEDSINRVGYEGEVMSVRDYRSGDPLKYIHWKATAKTDQLKTVELSRIAYQPVIIDFNELDIKNIEYKISCITYTIQQFIKKNIPIGLKISRREYKPNTSSRHKIKLLTELALYGTEDHQN